MVKASACLLELFQVSQVDGVPLAQNFLASSL